MLKLITRLYLIGICCVLGLNANAAHWSEKELRVLKTFQLNQLDQQKSNGSNHFAYSSKAAALGKAIFFDKRFSLDGSIACASCHQPEKGFTDGLKKAKGIHKTGRNTQTLLGAAHQTWFYWDGRKDSLWSQALIPFEAADEMASSRVAVLRILANDRAYRQQYEALFGPFPMVVMGKQIPSQAGPWGDQQTRNHWYRIPRPIQDKINQAYANVGKAVAAYERTIVLPQTQFDRYLKTLFAHGEDSANKDVSRDALAGMKLFIDQSKTHCMRCHNGPMLSNGDFHNINTGNFKGKQLDFGRFLGIQVVTQDQFNCLGRYSDAKPEDCRHLRFLPKQVHGETQGAFKTPTLRYLNQTGPYFHDGRFSRIEQVIAHYKTLSKDNSELPPLTLTEKEVQSLVAFLALLYAP